MGKEKDTHNLQVATSLLLVTWPHLIAMKCSFFLSGYVPSSHRRLCSYRKGEDAFRRKAVCSSGGYCISSGRDGGGISHREVDWCTEIWIPSSIGLEELVQQRGQGRHEPTPRFLAHRTKWVAVPLTPCMLQCKNNTWALSESQVYVNIDFHRQVSVKLIKENVLLKGQKRSCWGSTWQLLPLPPCKYCDFLRMCFVFCEGHHHATAMSLAQRNATVCMHCHRIAEPPGDVGFPGPVSATCRWLFYINSILFSPMICVVYMHYGKKSDTPEK